MERLIRQHINKFKKEPLLIGMYWDDKETLMSNIKEAIESDTPYNEKYLLTKKELDLFNKGKLLF